MSFIEKIFGQKPVAAPVAPPPSNNPANNPAPTGTQNSPGTAPNGVIPADGSGKDAKDQSPLATFGQLWEPPKPEDDASKTPNTAGTLDPQKVMEAAGKVDFTKVLSTEDLQKIQAGGEGAMQALLNALNKTSQTVFAQSTIASQRLVENAVETAKAELATQLPQAIRAQTSQDSLLSKNKAFSDPALQPLIKAVHEQIQSKFPKATPEELNTMTQEYLTGAANMIVPPQKQSTPSANKAKDDIDWEAYLTTPNPQ